MFDIHCSVWFTYFTFQLKLNSKSYFGSFKERKLDFHLFFEYKAGLGDV